jgi:PKD repeat protein
MSAGKSVASSIARQIARSVSGSASGFRNFTAPLVITASTATPVAGVSVAFTTNAGGTGATYSWDFGDGTVPSTSSSPNHYFVGNGPYTVTCTITLPGGATHSDTQTISPTTPPETSGQTLLFAEAFTADRSSASPGSFTRIAGSANLRSGPNGAKLAPTAGVGHSAKSRGVLWFGSWDLTDANAAANRYQVGGWFYFTQFPSSESMIIGLLTSNGAGAAQGLTLNSSGVLGVSLDYEVQVGNPAGATRPGTLQLNKWYWIGLAIGGTGYAGFSTWKAARVIVKEIGQPEVITVTQINSGTDSYFGIGCRTNNHTCKISYVTYHQLGAITDAGFPGDEVPPQTRNYIYQASASGSDSNNGVTGAWQTITKVNQMLDPTYYGIDSVGVDGVEGSGSRLVINSAAPFDVGVPRLKIYTPSLHLKSSSGQATIKSWHQITSGQWSVTGGYTGIYQMTMDAAHSKVGVWSNDVWHEQVASLAALDAAAAGASFNSGTTLYVKPFGSTDPRSDGKTYIHSKPNDDAGGVGFPVIAIAAMDCLVENFNIDYTASTGNGQYCVGDWTGFSGKLLVRNVNTRFTDKHAICYTINANNSLITTEDCNCEQGLSPVFTSYMASGTGNNHIYRRCLTVKGDLLPRSANGIDNRGVFYSHGGYGAFTSILQEDCDYGNNDVALEGITLQTQYVNLICSTLQDDCPTVITNAAMNRLPVLRQGGSMSNSSVVAISGDVGYQALEIDGTMSWTNNNFDLRLSPTGFGDGGLFKPGTLQGLLRLTFTGNTIRFGTTHPFNAHPVFRDMASVNIVSCNNNTYYIPAAAVFAKNFNDGVTTADRTFAQWQALGYDLNSTRIDP